MSDESYDPHLALANQNIGQIKTELNSAMREYEAAIQIGDEFSAKTAQREVSRLNGELDNYVAQAQKHMGAKQPQQQYQAPVSKEQRAGRAPHELDAIDLANITGLDPKTYMSYKQFYDAQKRNGRID